MSGHGGTPTTELGGAVVEAFDLTGELPTGLTVLEASAGTGKTYALAALAARYVAEEGLAASQLCVVSFTEAATAELRGRVRSRLAQAAAHLAAGGAPVDDDEVLTALGQVDDAERRRRVARLDQAVAEFDAATIATIHGFCHRVVSAGGGGVDVTLSADDADVAELVSDVYLARYGPSGSAPVELSKLVSAVEARLGLADAVMARPSDAARSGRFADRAVLLDEVADLVDELVASVLERRAAQRRRTFDSLLTDARDLLRGPTGPAAVAALRARFGVVMIDEFQDTDQVQWDIFRTAFLDGEAPVRVILVGDPKQSIYRFRGAELSAYLAARDFAEANGGRRAGLEVNRRSDQALLDALERLFAGHAFGDPRVAFSPVRAADPKAPSPLELDDDAPLQLRCVADDAENVGEARARIVPDLVGEVTRLLHRGTITERGHRRRLRASDIGVLVRSNADASRYAEALSVAGVPASSSSADSVLDSPAAFEWRILLRALERPTSAGRARAAALGWFVGLTVAEVDGLDDDDLGELMGRLRTWADEAARHGVPALLAALRGAGLATRVLARVGGERDLTDVDHVAELLVSATGGRPVGPSALLATLDALAAPSPFGSPEDAVAPELLARRIDRDDDTVKVLTVHMAKGLEFPVVLCPTLWTRPGGPVGVRHAWDGAVRRIDTNSLAVKTPGEKGKDFRETCDLDTQERAGEAQRLLYVALTRAKHRLVLWWFPHPSPLVTLLGHACGGDDGTVDLEALVAGSNGCIARQDVPGSAAGEERGADDVEAEEGDGGQPLAVATADRRLDHRWRSWSFTGIQREAARHGSAGAEQVRSGSPTVDEPAVGTDARATWADAPEEGGNDEPAAGDTELAPSAGLPLQAAPGGKELGTLVHAVLERVDFSSPDLLAELRETCATSLRYRPLRIEPDELADGLLVALQAPLGGPLGDLRLVDLTRRDRLDELGFDLPLGALDAASITEVLLDHLPHDDLLRPWAEATARGGSLHLDVEGWLNGSIDLVARSSPTGPYWLADYKTNRLDGDGHHGPADLAGVMAHAGYPLQATLYLVALHRYLRWRLPGYDADRDLAGAGYLFLRAMDPSRTADDATGVLWWRPPTAALDELDALLAVGGRP